VPNPSNPQVFNRYGYVLNNPVNLVDPSGHISCSSVPEECEQLSAEEVVKRNTKVKYGWNVKGDDWSIDELRTIFRTGQDIESYVNSITRGNGLAWMNEYMGGVNIRKGPFKNGIGLAGNVLLPSWWGNDTNQTLFYKYYLVHELVHIWDARSGGPINHLPSPILARGPGDGLNSFIGGSVADGYSNRSNSRWFPGSGVDFIPPEYHFKNDPMEDKYGNPYANNSTADYLANSFALSVYASEYSGYSLPDPNLRVFINAYVSTQATQIP